VVGYNAGDRTSDAELEFQFVSDPFLAPGRVVVRHLPNQLAQILWQSRATPFARLPSPECSKCRAMPLEECLRFDDNQGVMPFEEPGEQNHTGAHGSGRMSRLHLAFLKHSDLLAKDEILGDDGGAGGKGQPDEREQPTFYKSLQDLLRTSERSDLIFAEDTGFSLLGNEC
jgi:hypothetical protein